MTTSNVIPDDEIAARCFARFNNDMFETYQLDPKSLFYTNRQLNYTICGFMPSYDTLRPRIPIDITNQFKLNDNDAVAYVNTAPVVRTVIQVEEK